MAKFIKSVRNIRTVHSKRFSFTSHNKNRNDMWADVYIPYTVHFNAKLKVLPTPTTYEPYRANQSEN